MWLRLHLLPQGTELQRIEKYTFLATIYSFVIQNLTKDV